MSRVCSRMFKFEACEKFKPQNTNVFEDLGFDNNEEVGLYRQTLNN